MLICFGTEQYKIAEHFSKNTTQWTTSAIGRNICRTKHPWLADKHAIEDELKIHRGKPVLPCF